MSRIARISGGVKATLRNLPSIMFFNEQSRVSSSTTHLLHGGLPTNSNSNWVVKKKSNFSFFFNFNPNVGIINLFLPSLLPFTTTSKPFTTTSKAKAKDKDKAKDKEGGSGTSKVKDHKVEKEKVKILKVLVDYDEPHNHLVDGVKVLSMVLQEWKKFRPKKYELDYKVDDLVNLNTGGRLSPYMVVDEKATGDKISIAKQTILRLLADYDDPKFADQVLFEAMDFWNGLISIKIGEIEAIGADSINLLGTIKDKHDEEVKCPSPSALAIGLRAYKVVLCNFDNPVSMVEEIDALIKKALVTKKNGEAKL